MGRAFSYSFVKQAASLVDPPAPIRFHVFQRFGFAHACKPVMEVPSRLKILNKINGLKSPKPNFTTGLVYGSRAQSCIKSSGIGDPPMSELGKARKLVARTRIYNCGSGHCDSALRPRWRRGPARCGGYVKPETADYRNKAPSVTPTAPASATGFHKTGPAIRTRSPKCEWQRIRRSEFHDRRRTGNLFSRVGFEDCPPSPA